MMLVVLLVGMKMLGLEWREVLWRWSRMMMQRSGRRSGLIEGGRGAGRRRRKCKLSLVGTWWRNTKTLLLIHFREVAKYLLKLLLSGEW